MKGVRHNDRPGADAGWRALFAFGSHRSRAAQAGCSAWGVGRPFELDRSGVCGVCSRTNMTIELDREEDGRWLTEIPELPGVMAYGRSQEEALAKVKALALRVMADRLEHGEAIPELVDVFSVTA
jgi:predicted RNase H-like HicB family nuclease